ncbi:MAG: integrase core domain-containing protein [Bacteroidota bacterium]
MHSKGVHRNGEGPKERNDERSLSNESDTGSRRALVCCLLPEKASRKRESPPWTKAKISDEDLLVEIRAEILNSVFTDEGYKKIWKRMRKRGIKASGRRVNQLMRDNNLLSVTRPKPDIKVNEHTGTITTEMPNRMWGTDGKKFYTMQEGWCWFFGVIDHFNDEIMAWYSAKKGDRFAAMEPLKMAVQKTFGNLDRDVCIDIGLFLRTDHGSQYDSNDFQKELKFLGLVYSPAFVRSPECNGIIERFHRTLDEQVFDKQVFESLEQARLAIAKFIEDYNREWLLHRLGLTSPLGYRHDFEKGKNDAA